jgi:hypothetical protein
MLNSAFSASVQMAGGMPLRASASARLSVSGRVPARFFITVATAILCILPFLVVSTNGVQAFISSRALAATDATVSPSEDEGSIGYGRALRERLARAPDTLLNLRDADILFAFAQPQLRRMEGPVRLWQYRTENCVMDVYFREQGKALSVVHYELRPRDKAVFADHPVQSDSRFQEKSCVQALLSGEHGADFAAR